MRRFFLQWFGFSQRYTVLVTYFLWNLVSNRPYCFQFEAHQTAGAGAWQPWIQSEAELSQPVKSWEVATLSHETCAKKRRSKNAEWVCKTNTKTPENNASVADLLRMFA